MMPDYGLRGQRALVTGGASGIGRGIVEALAAHGVHVALTYLSSDAGAHETVAAAQAHGVKALAIKADLTDETAVNAVVNDTVQFLGGIDILVTNAGGILGRKATLDISRDTWDKAFALNVTSTFLCCKAVIPHMTAQGGGSMVLMSSQAAFDGGGVGSTYYAATKGAILTYTRGLAKELAPQRIRVNCVAPGLIDTRFHDIHTPPDMRATVRSRIPLGREGTPADVAGAVIYLTSELGAYLTGETIIINGGQSMY
ncbi:MAG: SDR family NAD(P)-dependent oxidoreductase [Roseiflexaceae bacterium]|jgi:3-oxoacyl-[acyl-carrier protein] reductase|nr:SDR family oxidoreductase [Chloroflexaceae bacterium]MCE2851910.1 SDR family oxidoreductase [Chloroflexaceae bacterium]